MFRVLIGNLLSQLIALFDFAYGLGWLMSLFDFDYGFGYFCSCWLLHIYVILILVTTYSWMNILCLASVCVCSLFNHLRSQIHLSFAKMKGM